MEPFQHHHSSVRYEMTSLEKNRIFLLRVSMMVFWTMITTDLAVTDFVGGALTTDLQRITWGSKFLFACCLLHFLFFIAIAVAS